jgi:Domain of unknown function (DUF4157)
MDATILRRFGLENELDSEHRNGPSTPGKSSVTSRLTPAAQLVFRVSDPETARALGEAMSPGSRIARDANGVAAGADAAVAAAASSNGSSLPTHLQRQFEGSLGADLSSVRVHTGAESQAAAHAVGAKAYTVGQDIHFGAGKYQPDDPFGMHLLAHEVAHTVQQAGGSAQRQNKLEVSTPHDAAEHEADRAADAMVRGAPASIGSGGGAVARQSLQRNPFDFGAPQQEQDGFGFGPQPQQPWNPLPGMPNPGNAGDMAGNVNYDISGSSLGAAPIAVNLASAMPESKIKDPGAIPGWITPYTPPSTQFGPYNTPGKPTLMLIEGDQHSAMAKSAWREWGNFSQKVATAWTTSKGPLDSFVQEKKGDPVLDKLIEEMGGSTWLMNVKHGEGNLTKQGDKVNVNDGVQINKIDSDLASKEKGVPYRPDANEFHDDAKATVADRSAGTKGSPVQAAVSELNGVRQQLAGEMKVLAGEGKSVESAADAVKAATMGLKVKALEKDKEAKEEEKKKIEDGTALIAKVSPKAAELYSSAKGLYDEFAPFIAATQQALGGAAKAGSGDYVGGGMDVAKGVLSMVKWQQLSAKNKEISAISSQIGGLLDAQAKAAFDSATKAFEAANQKVIGHLQKVQGILVAEKAACEKVATVLEGTDKKGNANWKGKDAKDGKLAADAMRALPIAQRILSAVGDVNKAISKQLPSESTRSMQGHTLATQGQRAPGDAEVKETAGWILGAVAPMAAEQEHWQGIVGRMQLVASSLGVV